VFALRGGSRREESWMNMLVQGRGASSDMRSTDERDQQKEERAKGDLWRALASEKKEGYTRKEAKKKRQQVNDENNAPTEEAGRLLFN
jgi:hypothetical protein